MKIKASPVRLAVCVALTLLISAFSLFTSLRTGKTQSSHAVQGQSLLAASKTSNASAGNVNSRWIDTYSRLPLGFEENVGQTTQEVRFLSHGRGYGLFLTGQGAALALRRSNPMDLSPLHRTATLRALRMARQAGKISVVRMHFEGANPAPQIAGLDRLPARVDYFIGNNPKNWRTNVPSYARVKYEGIYPGVDLFFYGNQRRLEYDFVVAPDADPKAIKLNVEGARKLRIDSHGNLVMSVSGGEVELEKPHVYQEVAGERREIAANYALGRNHRVTFAVSGYDPRQPLIIDPVLNYSTYLGGSADDQGFGIAVDSLGDAFVAGTTFSTDFPTTSANAFNPGPPGASTGTNGAVFVTEINPAGTQQLYSTYLSGSGGEMAFGIALDPSSNVYVTGETFSTDFPTTSNALNPGPLVSNTLGTGFVSKINPALSGNSSLVYSTYLGGTGGDFGNAVAADASENAYVAGMTFSSDFPTTTNALQPNTNPPTDILSGTAFLSRIDTTLSGGASLIYSTYLGGDGAGSANLGFGDGAFGVAADSANNAYLAGATSSSNFPTTTTAFQQTAPAAFINGTAFLSRIDTTMAGNASLIYSTYLGGDSFDFATAIALGPNNVAYTTGTTDSLLFPTTPAGAFQTTGNANGAAFITLIDTGHL